MIRSATRLIPTALLLVLASCGANTAPGTLPPSTATAIPTPALAQAPCLPVDTPIKSAPADVAAPWLARTYPPATVPACSEVNSRPPSPTLVNLTSGTTKVDAARAAVLELEFLRTTQWHNWAQRVADSNTYRSIEAGNVGTQDEQIATAGYRIYRESGPVLGCDYPSSLWLVSIPGKTASNFSAGAVTQDGVAFVYEYVGDCVFAQIHPDGSKTTVTTTSASPNASGIVVFQEMHDPQLGDVALWQSNTLITKGSEAQAFVQGLGLSIPPSG